MTRNALAVIVPTYRRPHELRRCLDGLVAQTEPADEVVVVGRADDEAARRVHAAFGGVAKYVPVERGGQVAALLAGATATRCELIAFIDDDAVPRPDWTHRLRRLLADPAVCAAGGRDVVHHDEGIEGGAASVVGVLNWWGKPIGNHHLGVGGVRSVKILKGCNCAYRRNAFAAPQGLRGAGAEPMNDLATSLRASTMGTVLYDPELVVDHYPAERFDHDGRHNKTRGALLDAVHNQTIAIASLAPGTRRRYGTFYFCVGDAVTPGIARSIVAAMRAEPFSRGRFIATQRTLFAALKRARKHPLEFRIPGNEPTGGAMPS